MPIKQSEDVPKERKESSSRKTKYPVEEENVTPLRKSVDTEGLQEKDRSLVPATTTDKNVDDAALAPSASSKVISKSKEATFGDEEDTEAPMYEEECDTATPSGETAESEAEEEGEEDEVVALVAARQAAIVAAKAKETEQARRLGQEAAALMAVRMSRSLHNSDEKSSAMEEIPK